MNDAEFLRWIADRLVYVYGEKENTDFVLSLYRRAASIDGVSQEPAKFRVRHIFTGNTGIVMSEKNGMYSIMWDAARRGGGPPVSGVMSNEHVHPADEFDKISMHPVRAYEVRPNALVYEVLAPIQTPNNLTPRDGESE